MRPTQPASYPNTVKAAPDFRRDLASHGLAPLWDVLHALVTPTPASPAQAARWRYQDVRRLVLAAGDFISAEQAERRVLILENPGLAGQSAATRSLYAGVQLVLPGEIARSHRHSQTALRFVIEGDGGFTIVDGERLTMAPGDLVLTPSWTWHDHGNDGDGPMIWLDGLDVQIVNLLDASFSEPGVTTRQDSVALSNVAATAALGPLDAPAIAPRRFPFAEVERALGAAVSNGLDPCHGVRLRYRDPNTGDWPLATMGPYAQFAPAGFSTRDYRSTDAGVFLVHAGSGRVCVGDVAFDVSAKDIFAIPSWINRRIEVAEDLTLLAFSDRPTQEKLGLWREQRGVEHN